MFSNNKPNAKEVGKKARSDIKSSQRDIEREIRDLDRAEEKAKTEARVSAKKGDMAGAKIMAAEVVRIRNAKEHLLRTKSHLSSVSLRTHEMQAMVTQVDAIKVGAKAMHQANAQMSPAQLAAVMKEFDKQNTTAELQSQMLDDMFDDPDMDQEADAAVNQIFDELGVEAANSMVSAPKHKMAQKDEDAKVEKVLRGLTM